MGGSCCEKKVLCNRPPLSACECKKEKKCCKEEKKCCKEEKKCYKEKKCCEEEKCLTASELACLIEKYRNRIPPFPPVPVPTRTVPFVSGTVLTFDEEAGLWVFSICVPNSITPGFNATFRVGASAVYPTLVAPSSGSCSAGFTAYNILFTEAVGTILTDAGLITGVSSNFSFSAAGVVTFP